MLNMIPRCLILFENSCKSGRTFKSYKYFLDLFLNWLHKDYESLLLIPTKELEDSLQDYCIFLKRKVEDNKLNPNSIPNHFNPIWKFLKVNRVKIDKESITQLYPDKKKLGGDKAITTEQLGKLLNATSDKRDKAVIHLFSATGARPEAVSFLKLKHIENYENGYLKVILYSDDFKHEMITFLHPEAVSVLNEYLEERKDNGENLTSDSWLFAVKGNQLSYNTLENMMVRIWKRSGIKRVKIGNRYDLASTTSIRKRFDTILEMNPNVSMGALQYLMDHSGYLSGTHYRRPTEAQIFKTYRAITSELMISNEMRFEINSKQKEEDLLKKEIQKDSKIRELEKRLENTDKLLQTVLLKLENQ